MSPIRTERTRVPFEGADISVFTARPDGAPPRATVLMLGAIWSVTEHIEDLCQRLAREGFGAIAPCLFRGEGIPARNAAPEALTQAFIDFDDRRCLRDLRHVARLARAGRFGSTGALVSWGFCLGGRFAHMLPAVCGHLDGAIVFYGRMRFERQPIKPFLPIELAGLIEVPYLGHFAEFDDLIPLPDVDELRTALTERRLRHDVHVYRGAKHSFFDPTRPEVHDPAASALAWSRSIEFLRTIGAP
ncbi:MAG: dienelactone hydrolase family protein [Burkholderiales bacterium]|nr:dienelactone hydrolase family protein [Burkholderiales bacterium]